MIIKTFFGLFTQQNEVLYFKCTLGQEFPNFLAGDPQTCLQNSSDTEDTLQPAKCKKIPCQILYFLLSFSLFDQNIN